MVLILSSCITGQDDVGPEWIRRPPVIFGSLVFIGHGYGENTTEARTAALDDALASMSAGAGYDLSQYYLREIVSTDGIAELGTYINSEYSTPSGGGFEHYVAVVTPESSYNSLMSEDYVQMLEREDRIRGYLDSAGERYRANEDTEALDSTLRALAVSLEGPVEDESLNSSSILSIAMEYLGNIELEANDAGVVTAKRSKGIFHPYIVSGKIDASYERFDADGNRERASVTCLTDSRGRFAFYVTDPYTIRDSEVIFSVSLPSDAMRAIELNAPEGFLDGFYRLLSTGDTLGHIANQLIYASTPDSLIIPEVLNSTIFDNGYKHWTTKNLGPIYIPYKGFNMIIDTTNYLPYRFIIEYETRQKLQKRFGKIYLGNSVLNQYTFKENYYFMAGDNVANSHDSRYFGYVPETFIIGVASKILPSH